MGIGRPTTHGHGRRGQRSPTLRSWKNMLRRCRGGHDDHVYANRGISVCERWLRFDAFLEDMGERPDGTTLDRIDNNRGYEPGNCRWLTQKGQNNNLRHNIRVEFNGESLTVAQWSEKSGIPYRTLLDRIKRGKMSVREALTMPVRSVHNWRKPLSVVALSSDSPHSKPSSNPN